MTPDQLDAVLPRVPAGIPALTGDLTDPDDRAIAIRWLMELYREADCANDLSVRYWAPPTSPPAPGITYHGPIPTGRDDRR